MSDRNERTEAGNRRCQSVSGVSCGKKWMRILCEKRERGKLTPVFVFPFLVLKDLEKSSHDALHWTGNVSFRAFAFGK